MGYAFLIVAVALNGAANVLIKLAARRFGAWNEPGALSRLATDHHFMAGLLLFALNVGFYAAALARLNLSTAYPILVAGSIIVVVLASRLFLSETLADVQLIGFVFLILGATLITHESPR